MPARGANVVDIAQPRGELGDVLEGGHRQERLADIVLTSRARALFERILQENRSRERLEQFSVSPRRKLLFHGPPGCGKTLGASVLAGEMGLPLMTVRLDSVFSRFLGATANHLRAIFGEMPRRPGIYLFDEFDSIAKARGDSQDVGEMNRIVTAFLQLIDSDTSNSIVIAATNHAELLDRAIFRRFDVIVPFSLPTASQIEATLKLRLGAFDSPCLVLEGGVRVGAGHELRGCREIRPTTPFAAWPSLVETSSRWRTSRRRSGVLSIVRPNGGARSAETHGQSGVPAHSREHLQDGLLPVAPGRAGCRDPPSAPQPEKAQRSTHRAARCTSRPRATATPGATRPGSHARGGRRRAQGDLRPGANTLGRRRWGRACAWRDGGRHGASRREGARIEPTSSKDSTPTPTTPR